MLGLKKHLSDNVQPFFFFFFLLFLLAQQNVLAQEFSSLSTMPFSENTAGVLAVWAYSSVKCVKTYFVTAASRVGLAVVS